MITQEQITEWRGRAQQLTREYPYPLCMQDEYQWIIALCDEVASMRVDAALGAAIRKIPFCSGLSRNRYSISKKEYWCFGGVGVNPTIFTPTPEEALGIAKEVATNPDSPVSDPARGEGMKQ